MQCLLIYDIPDDRARQRVADACLDYGLQRIQYSAFVGPLSNAHRRALFGEIQGRVRGKAANIQLFPLDEQSWQGRHIIAQNPRDTVTHSG